MKNDSRNIDYDWHVELIKYVFQELDLERRNQVEALLNQDEIAKDCYEGIIVAKELSGAKSSKELEMFFELKRKQSLIAFNERIKEYRTDLLIKELFSHEDSKEPSSSELTSGEFPKTIENEPEFKIRNFPMKAVYGIAASLLILITAYFQLIIYPADIGTVIFTEKTKGENVSIQADDLIKNGDYEAALSKYTKAQNLFEKKNNQLSAEIEWNIVICLIHLGDYKTAENKLEELISSNQNAEVKEKAHKAYEQLNSWRFKTNLFR